MNLGVHETHCCIKHGCKYGDDDCPVETGVVRQQFPCENCSIEGMDIFFNKDVPIQKATELIEQTLRVEIKKLLSMLPEGQNKVFNKCLEPGKTLESTEEEKLRSLYDLCVRSVHSYLTSGREASS